MSALIKCSHVAAYSLSLIITHPPQVRAALGREWGSVCPLLQQLLRRTDSPGAVKARVLRCLSSWVLLDVPLSESEDLVQDCFSALQDPELFDTAVEAVVNAISQPDSQRCVSC